MGDGKKEQQACSDSVQRRWFHGCLQRSSVERPASFERCFGGLLYQVRPRVRSSVWWPEVKYRNWLAITPPIERDNRCRNPTVPVSTAAELAGPGTPSAPPIPAPAKGCQAGDLVVVPSSSSGNHMRLSTAYLTPANDSV